MGRRKKSLLILLSIAIFNVILISQVAYGTEYDYDVPYLYQLNYTDIGHSACAPTSITMLLRYYFLNSEIDVPEVYHSGIQGYRYHGPAIGYKNVSFLDSGLSIVDPEFRDYYGRNYSGLRSPEAAAQYLNSMWGGESYGGNASLETIINQIKERPLILNILWEGKRIWVEDDWELTGHYVVLRGYDDNSTPEFDEDDIFYVNDPGQLNGENRRFNYDTLFGPRDWQGDTTETRWYKDRIITFEPALSEQQRQYTVVVDNGNVQLDDINNQIWWEYYGSWDNGGDWYYPTQNGHWARWCPNLLVDGIYKIYVIFHKDQEQSDVNYVIYKPTDEPIETVTVNQKGEGWRSANLGTFSLKKDSYVQIDNVPAQCNVDAIRFEYFSPPSGRVTVDLDTKYWEDGLYQLRITAHATAGDVSSITISGPHIDAATVQTGGGDPHYLYDDGKHHDGAANDGLWWVLLNIKEPPVVGEIITFYITYNDGSSETKQKSIDGVLSETAQLLSPPDGPIVNTLTPKFEWSNPSIPELTYSVQVDDTNHNRVYDVYDLPDGTTSHRIPSGYLNWGTTYYWLVSGSDPNGNEALTNWDTFTTSGTAASTTAIGQPKFSLSQNYPNPCNPETTIEYSLADSCHVTLKIYNLSGQLIKTLIDEYQQAGSHKVTWYGDNDAGQEVASSVYFYRIKAGDFGSTKKMIVLK